MTELARYFRRGSCRTLLPLLMLLAVAAPARAWEPLIDSVMYHQPDPPAARLVTVFPDRLRELWLEALRRPEADSQCRAALTIALAHRRGMKGLEATVPDLVAALERPDGHPDVRLAAARAIIELDARDAAAALFRLVRAGDGDLCRLVEPALARWDYRPARDLWLERLGRPDDPGGGLILAIDGLAAVREERAVPALRSLTLSAATRPPVRLAAARALGAIRTSGGEADARTLIGEAPAGGVVTRLAAAGLLRRHQGEDAVRLLRELAGDAEPAVAAAALARLVEIDPALAVPLLDRALASPGVEVRSLAVTVLARQPGGDHLRRLGDRLADPHPAVRVQARRALHELAGRAEHREAVIREGERLLAAADWRSQEQAALLLAQLGHRPAAGRLVELLPSRRAEVAVAAAWGLRRLAVAETLPPALEFFRTPRPVGPDGGVGVPAAAVDQQLSQLGQFFGESRYRPADATLRLLISRAGGGREGGPARLAGGEARAAAIWALGLFHEGQPNLQLLKNLEGRLSDVNTPAGNEDERVRWMAAVTLGRMGAKEALPVLRRFSFGKPSTDAVSNACLWAVSRITGEAIPPAGTVEVVAGDWPLSPLGP